MTRQMIREHRWARLTLTPEEARENPEAMFGQLRLADDGSYDGPDPQGWCSGEPGWHLGPRCEACGLEVCISCDWKSWVEIEEGRFPADCPGRLRSLHRLAGQQIRRRWPWRRAAGGH